MKRVFGLLVMFLLSFAVVTAVTSSSYIDGNYDLTGGPINYACVDLDDYSTLVGGNSPNSSFGYGAVDICGYCYLCGVSDGICPEDFYSGVQGSCSEFIDPDCTGCISGTAQINLTGVGLVPATNAQVRITYDGGPHLSGRSGLVSAANGGVLDTTGTYPDAKMIAAVNASVQLVYTHPLNNGPLAVYASPKVNITELDVVRGAACYTMPNLVLQPAPCEADCTREGTDVCDATCAGVNGCSFSSGQNFSANGVATASDGKQLGDYVVLGSTSNPATCTDTEFYTYACNGPVQNTTQYDLSCGSTSADESILNLVTRVHRIWYDGSTGAKPVELVIMHWDEEIN